MYSLAISVLAGPIAFFFMHKARAGEPVPGVFGSLEPEPAENKTRNRSRSKKKQEPELQTICHSCTSS